MDIKVIAYNPDVKGVRVGYIDIYVNDGSTSYYIDHIAHFKRDDREWFSFPSYKNKFEEFKPIFRYADSYFSRTFLDELKKQFREFMEKSYKETVEEKPVLGDEEVPF
jgi:hypothetical protein